jgi:hypothetical protein
MRARRRGGAPTRRQHLLSSLVPHRLVSLSATAPSVRRRAVHGTAQRRARLGIAARASTASYARRSSSRDAACHAAHTRVAVECESASNADASPSGCFAGSSKWMRTTNTSSVWPTARRAPARRSCRRRHAITLSLPRRSGNGRARQENKRQPQGSPLRSSRYPSRAQRRGQRASLALLGRSHACHSQPWSPCGRPPPSSRLARAHAFRFAHQALPRRHACACVTQQARSQHDHAQEHDGPPRDLGRRGARRPCKGARLLL